MHTEFSDVIHCAPTATDVVVLAGDIGRGTHGIEWAKKSFPNKPTIYIAGNHEFYRGDISDIREIHKQAKASGIHFLEKEQVVIHGVRFLGCTLWTDIAKWSEDKVENARTLMNDYQYIMAREWWRDKDNCQLAAKYLNRDSKQLKKAGLFQPVVSYLMHIQSLAWLTRKLRQPFHGKTVVVTHHAPSYKSTEKETSEKRIILRSSYASDLEAFILQYQDAIDLWLHGHIHQAVNYQIHGVPVRSNPRGYPLFNPMGSDQPFGFDDNLLLYV